MMRAADAVFKYYIYLADDQDKLGLVKQLKITRISNPE